MDAAPFAEMLVDSKGVWIRTLIALIGVGQKQLALSAL